MGTNLLLAATAGLTLALAPGAALAADRHKDVDFRIRLESRDHSIFVGSHGLRYWDYHYPRYHGYYGRRGYRTDTIITRRGYIKRLYFHRGRVVDSVIIGRVDRYGGRHYYRGRHDRRYWDGWDDRYDRRDRYSRYDRRRDRRDHRYDDRRDRRDDRYDDRRDRRDDRDDDRRDRDDRRDDRYDSGYRSAEPVRQGVTSADVQDDIVIRSSSGVVGRIVKDN